VVFADEEWAKLRIPSAHAFIRRRLGQLSDALGDRDYLVGRFTVADIMMATVLRDVHRQMSLTDIPVLDAYLQRCLSRPAFQRAIDAQMADFTAPAPPGFDA
ncbi:MAG: glutathione binding-like protein, partial [Henriciella sp.]